MDLATVQQHYEHIVQTIKVMLNEQEIYFKARRAGNTAEHNLEKCRNVERNAQTLFKALYNAKPLIVDTDAQPLFRDYWYFMERTKVLLTTQYHWFKKKHDSALTKKCKALEKEMRERIKKYLAAKNNTVTPQLF